MLKNMMKPFYSNNNFCKVDKLEIVEMNPSLGIIMKELQNLGKKVQKQT